jgi:hypothetical protein
MSTNSARLRALIEQGTAHQERTATFLEFVEEFLVYLGQQIDPPRGGSRPGRSRNKVRDHHGAWLRWRKHYWGSESEAPIYTAEDFRRRFRVPLDIFVLLHDAVVAHDPYFATNTDAAGK